MWCLLLNKGVVFVEICLGDCKTLKREEKRERDRTVHGWERNCSQRQSLEGEESMDAWSERFPRQ